MACSSFFSCHRSGSYRLQHLTWHDTLILIVCKYYFAADYAPDDSLRTFDQTGSAARKIVNPFEWLSTNFSWIEYYQVSIHSGANASLVSQTQEIGRFGSYPLDRGLQAHHWIFVYPFTQHVSGRTGFAMLTDMGARVGESDHYFGTADQSGYRVLVGVDQLNRYSQLQVFSDCKVEKSIHRVLVLEFGNLANTLVEQRLVLIHSHLGNRHRIPLSVEKSAAASLQVISELLAEAI